MFEFLFAGTNQIYFIINSKVYKNNFIMLSTRGVSSSKIPTCKTTLKFGLTMIFNNPWYSFINKTLQKSYKSVELPAFEN